MTSDQDKFTTTLMQALHDLHSSSSEAALVAVGLSLIVGIVGGAWLAFWIFRGGLARAAHLSQIEIHKQ